MESRTNNNSSENTVEKASDSTTTILIVEDEPQIARFLELELQYEGYQTVVCKDGRAGYERAIAGGIDLIVLDLMLPFLSGIEVCRRVRRSSTVPIIMLTAKDDTSDKVTGLDSGADDYMTKPFAIEELLARIRVALKRKQKEADDQASKEAENAAQKDDLTLGDLTVAKLQHMVYYKNEVVALSKKEYDLLLYMMENHDIVLDRERLIEKVWGYDFMGDTNVTDVYIRYLRAKIDQYYNINYIRTVRGVGYMFSVK